jgi:hypothetical protein
LINIFRRLHRIFAHAWFQHRGVFWQVEGQTGLYVLFKTVCDNYELLPAENYKLPPEAEGLEPVQEVKAAAPTVLKPQAPSENVSSVEEDFINVGRTNTRRHIRQSPSVGSAVTTVLEQDEEDPDVTRKLEQMTLAEEEGEGENEAGTEIPVIVETYEVDEHQDEASSEPPASEPVESSEVKPAAPQGDFTAMKSLEKEEAAKDDETKVEDEKPEVKDVEVAPEPEKEPEVKEEPKETEEAPAERAEEETKEEES